MGNLESNNLFIYLFIFIFIFVFGGGSGWSYMLLCQSEVLCNIPMLKQTTEVHCLLLAFIEHLSVRPLLSVCCIELILFYMVHGKPR